MNEQDIFKGKENVKTEKIETSTTSIFLRRHCHHPHLALDITLCVSNQMMMMMMDKRYLLLLVYSL